MSLVAADRSCILVIIDGCVHLKFAPPQLLHSPVISGTSHPRYHLEYCALHGDLHLDLVIHMSYCAWIRWSQDRWVWRPAQPDPVRTADAGVWQELHDRKLVCMYCLFPLPSSSAPDLIMPSSHVLCFFFLILYQPLGPMHQLRRLLLPH